MMNKLISIEIFMNLNVYNNFHFYHFPIILDVKYHLLKYVYFIVLVLEFRNGTVLHIYFLIIKYIRMF